MPEPPDHVDVNVPRFNQAIVAVLTAIAFVAQWPWLVAGVFTVLAVSWAAGPHRAPLTRLYVRAIRPIIMPGGPAATVPAAPPRFAQLLGKVVLGLALIAFISGWPAAGWVLTLIVTALATLAAATRLCVGCLIYARATADG